MSQKGGSQKIVSLKKCLSRKKVSQKRVHKKKVSQNICVPLTLCTGKIEKTAMSVLLLDPKNLTKSKNRQNSSKKSGSLTKLDASEGYTRVGLQGPVIPLGSPT